MTQEHNNNASGITVLVPAYNEEASIQKTVETIRAALQKMHAYEIIVINDGSSDKTGEIARGLGITLLEHEVNRGYGAALKLGMQHAAYDRILITDADGTYPLEDIPRLVEAAQTCDMAVGARTGKIVQVPLLRRPAKWMITKLSEYLSGRTIPDLNSGFRVFRKDTAMRFLSLYPDGFSFTTTITLSMLTNGYSVKFLPINYLKRVGKSSIHPIRDFINFTILIIRICAYFKPLNVFLPPAMFLVVAGVAKGALDYSRNGHLGLLGFALALTGVQMVFIALLADLIDRRMKL